MRLTPIQFSISVSIVVLLLAGAVMTGYFYGLKKAEERSRQLTALSVPAVPLPSEEDPSNVETPAPVTFYTVLTEPREEDVSEPPKPVEGPAGQLREEAEHEPELPDGGLSLILQVASYRGREAAAKLLESLASEGYSGTIQVADLGERGIWYRVRIGPYGSESEANRVLEELRTERDLKGYVVR